MSCDGLFASSRDVYFMMVNLFKAKPKRHYALVLNYHHILPEEMIKSNLLFGYSHSTTSFESHIKWLCEHLDPTTDPTKENGFLITFDDCSLGTYQYATPILEKYGLTGHFFVVEEALNKTIWIDKYFLWLSYVPAGVYRLFDTEHEIKNDSDRFGLHHWLWNQLADGIAGDYMVGEMNNSFEFSSLESIATDLDIRLRCIGKAEINDLKSRGHQIGFHSRSHALLSRLNQVELDSEVKRNESFYTNNAFAIPFGDRSAYSDRVLGTLEKEGYGPIYLNHSSAPKENTFGRLNLPNSKSVPEIEYHINRHFEARL